MKSITLKHNCLPGISVLVRDHPDWLDGGRVGLVSHLAAVDCAGRQSAACLLDAGVNLAALFGPEHGFFGAAGAGEPVGRRVHPTLGIPVYSLYGRNRKPAPTMLKGIDTLVVDLQDLGVRCYTYVSTLKLVLEAAVESQKTVIVADRPIPFAGSVDGPVTDPDCESFVAALRVPMVYGMTPGETARWLRKQHYPGLALKVAPCRVARSAASRPPWIPPSPGIVSRETALCYPATVFSEAFPHLDHGRATGLPFQVLGAPWLDGSRAVACLAALDLPGVVFLSHPYELAAGRRRRLVDGLRLVVTNPDLYRPCLTAVAIVWSLQACCAEKRLWGHRRARPGFFDKLFGTASVREKLLQGKRPRQIARGWQKDLRAFEQTRTKALLYRRTP